MRIAIIHGINNEANTPDTIERCWWEALTSSWTRLGFSEKPKPVISVAYYADILAAAAKGSITKAVEMGPAAGVSTGFAVDLLKEYAQAAGVTQADLNAAAQKQNMPLEAVEQGIPHEGWVIAFADLLEKILPDKGLNIAELFLRQAAVYVSDKVLATKIDNKVRSDIFGERPDPTVVVAHSLGTVVTYRLLASAEQQARNVPLFVTLGSPLSVNIMKPILPAKGAMPKPPIGQWVNGRRKDDFVTLGKPIVKASIGFDGVIDEIHIDNDESDKHSIAHYLGSPSISARVYNALYNS